MTQKSKKGNICVYFGVLPAPENPIKRCVKYQHNSRTLPEVRSWLDVVPYHSPMLKRLKRFSGFNFLVYKPETRRNGSADSRVAATT